LQNLQKMTQFVKIDIEKLFFLYSKNQSPKILKIEAIFSNRQIKFPMYGKIEGCQGSIPCIRLF